MGSLEALAASSQPVMFALIAHLFTSLFGPKIGGTPTLNCNSAYYAKSGRLEIHQNAGPQGSDGPMAYDAPYLTTRYNPRGPDMQTVQELGVSGRKMYGV